MENIGPACRLVHRQPGLFRQLAEEFFKIAHLGVLEIERHTIVVFLKKGLDGFGQMLFRRLPGPVQQYRHNDGARFHGRLQFFPHIAVFIKIELALDAVARILCPSVGDEGKQHLGLPHPFFEQGPPPVAALQFFFVEKYLPGETGIEHEIKQPGLQTGEGPSVIDEDGRFSVVHEWGVFAILPKYREREKGGKSVRGGHIYNNIPPPPRRCVAPTMFMFISHPF